MENFEKEEWAAFAEAASIVGVHFTTLHKWQKENKLPSVKRGSRRWIRKSDCEEIKAAFEAHGSRWFESVSDDFKVKLNASHDSLIEESALDDTRSIQEEWNELLIEEAQLAHENGYFEGASHLFNVFIKAAKRGLIQS